MLLRLIPLLKASDRIYDNVDEYSHVQREGASAPAQPLQQVAGPAKH